MRTNALKLVAIVYHTVEIRRKRDLQLFFRRAGSHSLLGFFFAESAGWWRRLAISCHQCLSVLSACECSSCVTPAEDLYNLKYMSLLKGLAIKIPEFKIPTDKIWERTRLKNTGLLVLYYLTAGKLANYCSSARRRSLSSRLHILSSQIDASVLKLCEFRTI
jgi:hypothetical protein